MNDEYKWEVAHLNFSTVQLCNCTNVQMCNCTTVQLYKCATVQQLFLHPRLTTPHTEITITIIKNLKGSIFEKY